MLSSHWLALLLVGMNGFLGVGRDRQPDFTGAISGEFRFVDSRTYAPEIQADGIIHVDDDLTLSAANGARPYVTLTPSSGNVVTIHSSNADASLVIDGLWLGVFGAAGGGTMLVIDGTWRKVTLRNTTIDPGGQRAAAVGQAAEAIPAVRLVFAGAIDDAQIDSTILGRIEERQTKVDPCATDTVSICNSIIRGETPDPAILLRNAALRLDNCTVLGDVVCGRLDASQVLVDGRVRVEDQQNGCFRFSAAARGGRVPRPYESHWPRNDCAKTRSNCVPHQAFSHSGWMGPASRVSRI